MEKTQELSALAHCVYKLNYHLVFVTKYRKKVITKEILEFLRVHFQSVLTLWKCSLVEFSGEQDHVHLLVEATPNLKLSSLVNNLKTTSSRRVRNVFRKHVSKYYWKPIFWTRAYCVISAGGAPLEVLKQYIKNQDAPRR